MINTTWRRLFCTVGFLIISFFCGLMANGGEQTFMAFWWGTLSSFTFIGGAMTIIGFFASEWKE